MNRTLTEQHPAVATFASLKVATPDPPEPEDSDGVILCICGYTHDDGFTICCDNCGKWQHAACMGLDHADTAEMRDIVWHCLKCDPRPRNINQAFGRQHHVLMQQESSQPTVKPSNSTKKSKNKSGAKKGKENGNGGAGAKNGQSDRLASGKAPSPKESTASSRRKTNQRLPATQGHLNPPTNGVSTPSVGAPSPGAYNSDRNGEDDEPDTEKFKYEFTAIKRDIYTEEAVEPILKSIAQPIEKGSDNVRYYKKEEFQMIELPTVAVRKFQDSSKVFSPYSPWSVFVESAVPKGDLVTMFRGQVGLQSTYKADSINQFGHVKHAKHHVLFFGNELVIDARQNGTESRFIKRSCRPNVTLIAIVLDNSVVQFGLVALEPIALGAELTIGWDWIPLAKRLIAKDLDVSQVDFSHAQRAAEFSVKLTKWLGSCSCRKPRDCLLKGMKSLLDDSSAIRRKSVNERTLKRRNARNSSAGTVTPGPDGGATDEETRSKKSKSRSRDITPASLNDMVMDQLDCSAREKRKLEQIVSQIAKQEQRDCPPNKRRKRAGTTVQSMSRRDSLAPSMASRKASVADASTGTRRTSSSSTESGRIQSPTASSRRRSKNAEPKANYVDAASQTDTESDNDRPFWEMRAPDAKPRAAKIPLRKRLMQQMVQERSANIPYVNNLPPSPTAPNPSDKQREREEKEAKETHRNMQSKEPGWNGGQRPENVSVKRPLSSNMPESPEGGTAPPAKKTRTNGEKKSAGPSLSNIFADEASKGRNGASMPNGKGNDVPQSNGLRPELHIQPPKPVLSVGSKTANPSNGPAQSPFSITNANVAFPTSAPVKTPTTNKAPKKLSLSDYGKRKHKHVDASPDKGQPAEKRIATANNIITTTLATSSNLKLSTVAEEPRKLAEALLPPAQPQHPTPSLPAEQRAATTGVR